MLYIWDTSAGLPHVVYLTKLDKVCPLVDQDVRTIYHSQACKLALEIAADVIGQKLRTRDSTTNKCQYSGSHSNETLVFADDYLEDQHELQSDQ